MGQIRHISESCGSQKPQVIDLYIIAPPPPYKSLTLSNLDRNTLADLSAEGAFVFACVINGLRSRTGELTKFYIPVTSPFNLNG